MALRRLLTLGILFFLSSAVPVFAQSFQGLGDLPGGAVSSVARDVSADGKVVVGVSDASGSQAFRWTMNGGMVGLGFLPGGSLSAAEAASADGSVIVGWSTSTAANGQTEAFRWVAPGSMAGLGDLPGGQFSSGANGVAAGGGVIAGMGDSGNPEAFLWLFAFGMTGLNYFPNGNSSVAYDIWSQGGNAILVGSSSRDCGPTIPGGCNVLKEAFYFNSPGPMTSLGFLSYANTAESEARAISGDGKVIVGYSAGSGVGSKEAFRYVLPNGPMTGLGSLGFLSSEALDVSGDGSIVVGWSDTGGQGSPAVASIWDATNGMRNLKSVLENNFGLNLTGWQLSDASGISDDGMTIVGNGLNPSGKQEAWVAKLAAATLTLVSPNGGEVWQAGTQHEIKWTSANFTAPVRLWISYEGYNPQFWVAVDLMQSTPNDGSYMWTVPNNPSTNCVIKVADAADADPWDVSDAPFTIAAPAQSLTVTAPNGGETWAVGSQQEIKWTSTNFSAPVRIDFMSNNTNPMFWTSIIANTPNDGSFIWTLKTSDFLAPVPLQGKIRVADATKNDPDANEDGKVFDWSDAPFTASLAQNTPTGKNVEVDVGNGVKVTFDNVTSSGETTLNVKTSGPPPPSGFKIMPSGLPVYFDIKTTAGFTGNITICIPYNDSGMTPTEEAKLRLHVYESPPGQWKDITKLPVDVSANIICGAINHLTLFAMMLGPSHFTFASPTQESYSIVVDDATLDGAQLANGDEIGVFTPAGLCVGASVWDGATPLALTAWADDNQTSLIDGYQSGDNMSFRIWDASASGEYFATPTYSIGNGAFGNGAFARLTSLNAVTTITRSLPLSQGWSWISFNVAPSDLSMDVVMAGVNNLVIVVDGAGQFYIPGVINGIGQMNPLEGYKIYLTGSEQISVTGKPVAATTPISLRAGWNFVSYLPSASLAAETALASIVANLAIAKNDEGKFFIPSVINSLGNMTQGEGYKLYLNATATLTYPQNSTSAKLGRSAPTAQAVPPRHFGFRRRTGESFSVVVRSVKVNGRAPQLGDEVGVFTPAGACVGAGVWDGAGILGISAWTDDDRTDIVDGFRSGEIMQFKFWDADKNREAKLNATFVNASDRFDLGAFAVVELESPALPTTFSLGQNYPNPFNAGTVISYKLPESGKVILKVYNLLGEQVRMLLNEQQNAGAYSIRWDGKDQAGRFVPSGVYLYRIQTGSYSAVRKAVFVK